MVTKVLLWGMGDIEMRVAVHGAGVGVRGWGRDMGNPCTSGSVCCEPKSAHKNKVYRHFKKKKKKIAGMGTWEEGRKTQNRWK